MAATCDVEALVLCVGTTGQSARQSSWASEQQDAGKSLGLPPIFVNAIPMVGSTSPLASSCLCRSGFRSGLRS